MPASSFPRPQTLLLRVTLPFSAAYFLSYLFRTVNAVLAPEIGRSIPLGAADIGLMTGAYFIAFAAAQLPLGLALDRFGPRRSESVLLLFAATGALAFSVAESVQTLVAARALVGFGVSACLMAALKANVMVFPPRNWALMNGVVLGAGGLGAVAAAAPVQAALALTDWRGIYDGVAALTLAAALALWLAVPERPAGNGGVGLGQLVRQTAAIFRDPFFWRVAPSFMISLGGFMAVQGLWAGPWLRQICGMTAERAATGLSVMAAGMALGYLLAGALAGWTRRFGMAPVMLGWWGMVVHAASLGLMAAGWGGAPMALCGAFGFTGALSTVNYAVLTRHFPPDMAGRTNTAANLLIFLSAFALQWGLGWVLDRWEAVDGRWPDAAWALALGLPAAATIAALIWQWPACRASRPSS